MSSTLFTRTRGDRLHFAAALVVTLSVLAADAMHVPALDTVRDNVYALFEPFIRSMAVPGRLVGNVADTVRFGDALRNENQTLRRNNLLLAAQVQRLSFLVSENAELRQLGVASQSIDGKVRIVEVIGVDPDPSHHVLIVGAGRDLGLYSGQPVLDAFGVVGRVIQTGQETARVMLVSDSRHSIPVRINRNGIRAILSGTGDAHELRLQFVPERTDIKVGDLLVTSGLGQDFPAGYPVARVSRVRQLAGDQFLDIAAVPVSALDRSRFLLTLFPPKSAAVPAPIPVPLSAPVPASTSVPVPAPAVQPVKPAQSALVPAAPTAVQPMVVASPAQAQPRPVPTLQPQAGAVPRPLTQPVAVPPVPVLHPQTRPVPEAVHGQTP